MYGMENNAYNDQAPQSGRFIPLGSKGAGLSYTTVVLANLIVSIILSGVILIFSLGETEAAKYLSLLASPIAIAVTLTLTVKVAKQPLKRLLPVKCRPEFYAIAVLLAFGALFSLSWINDGIVKLLELIGYKQRESFVPDVSGWKVLPVLITVAVIPAIMEEALFRGILLQNVEEEAGTVRAILISGFCFSLYHGSVEQTVYQFIVGCIFGFLAVRSRSVVPGMLFHFLNNAVIIVMLACGAYDEAGALIVSRGGEIALYITSALALIGGLVWLYLIKSEVKPCQKGSVKTFFMWAAIGIGAMAIIWIIGLF